MTHSRKLALHSPRRVSLPALPSPPSLSGPRWPCRAPTPTQTSAKHSPDCLHPMLFACDAVTLTVYASLPQTGFFFFAKRDTAVLSVLHKQCGKKEDRMVGERVEGRAKRREGGRYGELGRNLSYEICDEPCSQRSPKRPLTAPSPFSHKNTSLLNSLPGLCPVSHDLVFPGLT